MSEINEVKNLIKEFTKRCPTDIGDYDPRYSEYLAKCNELYKLDKRLTTLSLEKKDEYFFELLGEIKEKVQKIVTSNI